MKINYNPYMVRNRFNELLEEKSKRENRRISLLQVSKDTGIPYKTIYAWSNNSITRLDVHLVEKICRYFGVEVGDLLEITD